MLFNGKIKKEKFEALLSKHFGFDRLSKRTHNENGQQMLLYYVDGGHAGTWMSHKVWIFPKDRVEANIKSTAKMMKKLDKRHNDPKTHKGDNDA